MKHLLSLLFLLFFFTISYCQDFKVGSKVEAKWGEFWYKGTIVEVKENQFKVHYDGYGSGFDEWLTKDKFRNEGKSKKAATPLVNAAKADVKKTNHANASSPVVSRTPGKLYLRTSMFGGSLTISTIFLADDGTIVRNALFGIDPLNLSLEKTHNSANTGRYSVAGNTMSIRWENGQTVTWRLEFKGGQLSGVDGGIVVFQRAMPAGYKLNGRFSALASTANASSSRSFQFNDDGSFSMKSTGAIETADDGASSTSNNSGRYLISGNTLILMFANGQVTRSVICISTIGGAKHLIINRASYPQEQ